MPDLFSSLSRRAILAAPASLAMSALTAPVSPAAAQSTPPLLTGTKLTVTGYFRTPAFLVALHKGLFAAQDLDIAFHHVRLAPEHNRGLAEGRWPITLSSADTMLARTTQTSRRATDRGTPRRGRRSTSRASNGVSPLSPHLLIQHGWGSFSIKPPVNPRR